MMDVAQYRAENFSGPYDESYNELTVVMNIRYKQMISDSERWFSHIDSCYCFE